MLLTLALTALSLTPSPAKAGAQYRADRTWAPAFAGEGKQGGADEQAAPVRPEAMTPIDAERAFAADAQTLGQWTAFRKWSTAYAWMFVPEPVFAPDFLRRRKDPPRAIDWWPVASYMSCDGFYAVNKGGWKRPDGSVGYFITVWERQEDGGWRWKLDGGDGVKTELDRPANPVVLRAACGKKYFSVGLNGPSPPGGWSRSSTTSTTGDGTMVYGWHDDGQGHTRFSAWIAGSDKPVIDNVIIGSYHRR